MRWLPSEIFIGHDDAHHQVVKGNWEVSSTKLEATTRKSLNHGGREKFSYLISHVNVAHNSSTAIQKVLFPLSSIIILSLIFNQFLNTNATAMRGEPEASPLLDVSVGGATDPIFDDTSTEICLGGRHAGNTLFEPIRRFIYFGDFNSIR